METTRLTQFEQSQSGYTHRVKITAEDLTETATNTAQTLTLSVLAGQEVHAAGVQVKTAFEDASDAAFNTTVLDVGDGGDVNRLIEAMELNVNGTEDTYFVNPAANLPFVFPANDTIDIAFGSMAAKALNDIDTGELYLFLALPETTLLSQQ